MKKINKQLVMMLVLGLVLMGIVGGIMQSRQIYEDKKDIMAQLHRSTDSISVGMRRDEVHKVVEMDTLVYVCNTLDTEIASQYQGVDEYYVFGDLDSFFHILILKYKIVDNEITLTNVFGADEKRWLEVVSHCERVK